MPVPFRGLIGLLATITFAVHSRCTLLLGRTSENSTIGVERLQADAIILSGYRMLHFIKPNERRDIAGCYGRSRMKRGGRLFLKL